MNELKKEVQKIQISNFEKLLGRESILDTLDKENGTIPKSTEQVLENAIRFFTDKMHLAEQFVSIIPTYYDSANIWWIWDFARCCYVQVDEVDLLNKIDYSSSANIVNSKERTEIIHSLQQVCRRKSPKEIKKSWIQFAEEVIDIETGERFKATPDYFFVNPLPYSLGKIEDTPNMDRIFIEWVGENHQKILYEVIAYCLLRDYPVERIFCFIGAGSNGKSCYLKLIRKFVGDYNITTTDIKTMLSSRFETGKFRNKLVVMLGEIDFDNVNNTQTIKRLVSGKDPISIEYKNKGFLEYINYAKLLIATNNLPATNDKTIGWYRRWCIIDFPNQFDEKVDILSQIPEEEFHNLAMKCIGLIIEILKNRQFTNEGNIEDRRKKYESKSDPLEQFLKEFTIEDFQSHIWKGDFEKKLLQWCKESRHREMSEVAIGRKMKEKGFEQRLIPATFIDSGRARAWVGLKFKEGIEPKNE